MLGDRQDSPRHSIVAWIQQLGDEEVETIARREREQRFLMAGVTMSSCMYGTLSRRGHVAACGSTPCPTCMSGCVTFRTRVTLSLSLYYILLVIMIVMC